MTLLSISCVQLSDALSVPLIDSVGAAGSAWIRVSLGALLLMVTVRPDARSLTQLQWRSVILLGVLCAGLSVSFMSALELLPLGTAVAIEFLGPLGVALCRGGRGRGGRWPVSRTDRRTHPDGAVARGHVRSRGGRSPWSQPLAGPGRSC